MSESNSNPQTTNSTAVSDSRVGVDGQNNRVIESGGTDLGGGIYNDGGPVAAQTFQDTGDVFAPQFNFAGGYGGGGGGYYDDPTLVGTYDGDPFNYYGGANPGYLNNQPIGNSPPPPPPPTTPVGTFGGAANEGGVVTGGNVSAPIASGDDSTAQQTGGGSVGVIGDVDAPVVVNSAPVAGSVNTIGGDVDAPIVNIDAPVSAPVVSVGGDVDAPIVNSDGGDGGISAPISAGGDVDLGGGNIFTGNNAPINIYDTSEDVFRSALDETSAAVSSALDYSQKALNAVTESVKDPSERLGTSALQTVGIVGGFVALGIYLLNRKSA